MKEIEVGTEVLVRAEVDAFRTGLNSGVLIRVAVNGQKIWVRSEDIQLMRDKVESNLCTGNPEDGVSEVTVDDWLREDLELNTYHPEETDEGENNV